MQILELLKPSKKKVIILTALIVLAAVGFNFFGQKQQAPLQFASVKKQDIKSTVASSGFLAGKDSANLKFKSSGKLSFINVKAGDKVTAGQVIAGLDTQDLSITLQQAQNTYRDKQAIAEKAEDDVKDHSKDESFAQKVTRTTAQAARDSAYDSVKAAQRAFQDAVITSPIDGIVTAAIAISGQTVGGSDVIAQVVDTSEIYFDTDVDEADIGNLSLGQKTEVTLDSYPNLVFKGVVDQILPQTKTTPSGATVILVRIKLDDPKITFVNGLSGQASIIISEATDALTIPQEALRDDDTVLIQENNVLKPKKVFPGIKSDTDVEIKQGLGENDKVLLNPPAPSPRLNQNRSSNPFGGIFRFLGGGRGR